ncbi:helix-turn-helix transcriptional regulator [Streptomyces sp. XD-27]|uniref:helix-turn-helix domain-containing protein n=1 Tax=Streptomyces sp. XD-27 TaxID=3062779 RepID=UPI0026F445FF|nr:helix-turn-helix transcriptional regulator [Streptomyces sp. XD-27]WKX70996.1 helix-turn-helix transcriptional regulator [Streptomyces sp. XD-27]
MAVDEETSPEYLNPLQRFGRDVRQVRLARKLTQEHLAKATGYTYGYVSMVENGKLLASEKFAQGCDLAFGTGELFADLRRRVREGDHPSWFVPYVNLERKASQILGFSTTFIMGMLQTAEYAHAVFRAGHPREEAAVIEGKVAARMRRREVMQQEAPPLLWAVLHEASLRTVVGGPEVMAGQLEYLVSQAESPHVTLQVLPFAAGAPATGTALTLLVFEDSPAVLFTEGPQGGRLSESAKTVSSARETYDRLRAHAMSPDASVAYIKTLREEYTS